MKQGNLKPFLKWPGGKSKELSVIFNHLPDHIHAFYEPFVGGGAVFFAIPDQVSSFYINDRSEDLITLYTLLGSPSSLTISLDVLNQAWKELDTIFVCYQESLVDLFLQYRKNKLSFTELKSACKILLSLVYDLLEKNYWWEIDSDFFKTELIKTVGQKIRTMKRNEIKKKSRLPAEDIPKNLLTAFKQSFYAYMRLLLNKREKYNLSETNASAIYYFIRTFCYSSMFRYNKNGDFNVPYGGMSYNTNQLGKKIAYMESEPFRKRLQKTKISALDFEVFLDNQVFHKDDFIFLDPPYDSDFSTYDKNTFEAADQERLAEYMINNISCNWMMVIKNTDFIYNLYANHPSLHIQFFDKKYGVSFMNRNNKAVTHLIITNYFSHGKLIEGA